MKFMSFNTQHCLNYIERQIDFEVMAKAIRDTGADIVGLNEMRGAGTDPEYTAQTEKLAELTGLNTTPLPRRSTFRTAARTATPSSRAIPLTR